MHLGVLLGFTAILHQALSPGTSQVIKVDSESRAFANTLIKQASIRFGGARARELERFIKFFIVGAIGLSLTLAP
jgi:hypothetical protein